MILPIPPPFHHTPLPVLPAPLRKLHVVRFCTHTSSAFHTMIPFSPSAPPSNRGPKFWALCDLLQGADPGFVPSTITLLRFIPRRYRPGFVTRTPAGTSRRRFGERARNRLVVAWTDQDPVVRPGRVDCRLDRRKLAANPVVAANQEDPRRGGGRKYEGMPRKRRTSSVGASGRSPICRDGAACPCAHAALGTTGCAGPLRKDSASTAAGRRAAERASRSAFAAGSGRSAGTAAFPASGR